VSAGSDTSPAPRRRAGAAEPAEPAGPANAKPHLPPLQPFGDPDATVCTGDSCEIPADAPTT
jgi:hypothetical protein